MPEGEVISGARAVFTTLTYAPGMAWLLWALRPCAGLCAGDRGGLPADCGAIARFFYHLTRFTFGRNISPLRYAGVEWLFLRILAAIYFIAFASLGLQITGLIGARGILPAGRYLAAVHDMFGIESYWMAPSHLLDRAQRRVFDRRMRGRRRHFAGPAGGLSWNVPALVAAVHPVSFPLHHWTGLPVVPVGHAAARNRISGDLLRIVEGNDPPVPLAAVPADISLGRGQAFESRPDLAQFDAMNFHYWTQPLPTPVAWYMAAAAALVPTFLDGRCSVHRAAYSVPDFRAAALAVLRRVCILFLQALIFVTGNYTFFNLLTMALCLFLFDDAALAKLRLRMRNVRTRPARGGRGDSW